LGFVVDSSSVAHITESDIASTNLRLPDKVFVRQQVALFKSQNEKPKDAELRQSGIALEDASSRGSSVAARSQPTGVGVTVSIGMKNMCDVTDCLQEANIQCGVCDNPICFLHSTKTPSKEFCPDCWVLKEHYATVYCGSLQKTKRAIQILCASYLGIMAIVVVLAIVAANPVVEPDDQLCQTNYNLPLCSNTSTNGFAENYDGYSQMVCCPIEVLTNTGLIIAASVIGVVTVVTCFFVFIFAAGCYGEAKTSTQNNNAVEARLKGFKYTMKQTNGKCCHIPSNPN